MAAVDAPSGPRIVGLGGLNLDYIVVEAGLAALSPAARDALLASFRAGSEVAVTEAVFRQMIAAVEPRHVAVRPGGSSFNTVLALAGLDPSFKLGFVGCIGARPADSPVARSLARHRIDSRNVTVCAGREHGSCLAVVVEGERWLATTPGANDDTARRLRDDLDAISATLAKASIVHASSLLDDDAPSALLAALTRARQVNPALKISLDPGAHWSRIVASDHAVRSLADLADWIFLNGEEFAAWRDADARWGVNSVLFRKAPGLIQVYRGGAGPDALIGEVRQPILAPASICDPTGAGDAFAAGALSVLAVRADDLLEAAEMGLGVARAKLAGRRWVEGRAGGAGNAGTRARRRGAGQLVEYRRR